MGNPVVELFNESIFINTQVALIDLFNFTDRDGDALDFVLFDDYQSDGTGGQLLVNGVAQSNGGRTRIEAEDLATAFYRAGSRIAWEGYRVIAYDVNGEHSEFNNSGRLYTVRENVTRPNVQNLTVNALANELTPLAPFLIANDPDGYPVTQWFIGDSAVDNGVIVFKGVDRPQGERFLVLADEVDQVFYRTEGPASGESLDKFAYDGQLWSRLSSSALNTIPNVNRPVAQFNRADLMSEEVIDMATLVNLTDDDGNTMEFVELWNTSPHTEISGTIFVEGVAIAPRQWERVTPAQLEAGSVLYQAPDNDFDDHQIRYRGFDGKFLSNNGTISLSTEFIAPPTQPELASDGFVYQQQLIDLRLESLFTRIDTGRPTTRYQFYDGNAFDERSARFEFNNNELAAETIHDFTAAEVDQFVRLRTGDFNNRHRDDVLVRVQNEDGLWSGWEKLTLRTEPEHLTAHDSGSTWNNFNLPRDSEGRMLFSYSFMQAFPDYETGNATDDDPPNNFGQFTQAARESVRRAFDDFEAITNVKFVEVSDLSTNFFGGQGGIYRFGNYGNDFGDEAAFAFFPSALPQGGDSWYDRFDLGQVFFDADGNYISHIDPQLSPYTFGYFALVHELMHNFGFSHVFDDSQGTGVLPEATRNANFSVLVNGDALRGDVAATTPQLYDVETLHSTYGVNNAFNSGDNLYSLANFWNERNLFSESLWDGAGTDTLSLVGSDPNFGFGNPNELDLSPGGFSSFNGLLDNVSIALRAEIENAIGSDLPDTILGNHLDNTIDAGEGADTIEGQAGDDLLTGGVGDDTFVFGVGDGDDVIDEQRLAGRDTIQITDFADKFVGAESLPEHFRFRKEGRDLIISLHLDDQDLSDGSIRISNHAWGSYQVETLNINGAEIDLRNLGQQATALDQKFEITAATSDFGNLVTPV